jgi:predicted nucleotidyltransferase
MRITEEQQRAIRTVVAETAGPRARVRVFGSRLRDEARGGDLDLMVELETPVERPAVLSATLSARLSRVFEGRRVDVVLAAPNLARLPIHEVAGRQGRLL